MPFVMLCRHRRLMQGATVGAAVVGPSVYEGGKDGLLPPIDQGAYDLYDVSCHFVTCTLLLCSAPLLG